MMPPTLDDLLPGRRMLWTGSRARRPVPCEVVAVQLDTVDGGLPVVSIVTETGRTVDVYPQTLRLLGPSRDARR